MSENKSAQLVIVGGGPGGYAAAFYAADLGMDVTLIDREANPGGVCLYRGCIPSKALLHVAKLVNESRDAAEWGIGFSEPDIDLDRLREWKNGVVEKLTGGLGQLSKQRKITTIRGSAVFLNPSLLRIETESGEIRELSFENAILATGSRPSSVPGLEIQSERIWDSTGALELRSIPGKLLVIGGGYIGLELGSVYAALGSAVTVVEMMPALLPGADKDLVRILARSLESRFSSIQLNTTVTGMVETARGLEVTTSGPDGEKTVEVDNVLVAVGRKPNSVDLGLENTGIQVDRRGHVQVNSRMQTAEQSIYAIGDLVGEPQLAHKASHEARVAVDVIAGGKAEFEPAAIPAVVFTDPEIAWAGLTESEAKEKDVKVKVARFPWAASGRAATIGRSDGVTKLIIDPESERVLGVGICGPGAGELISEAVLAIEMGAVVADLALTIHPHPTLSETVMEAAEVFFGHSTHLYRPRRK